MTTCRLEECATASHVFDATLLRENDVRGIVGQTLFPADAYALGRSFGSVAVSRGAASIAVGYDGRHSSPDLADALAAGLAACGLKVVTIGCGPTPMLYF
jgi:phosphomannomutase